MSSRTLTPLAALKPEQPILETLNALRGTG